MRVFLPVFFFLISQPATADDSKDCPRYQLDPADLTVLGPEMREQAEKPVCYANTAELISTLWVRKNTEQSDFMIDPIDELSGLMNSAEIEAILDAQNGRTAMSIRYFLRQWMNPGFETVPTVHQYGFQQRPNDQILETPENFKMKLKERLARLDSGVPPAIEFCSYATNGSNLIKSRTFRSNLTYLNTPEGSENLETGCGFHSAPVVAQKWKNGECQVGIYRFMQEGIVWIDENTLSKNTLRIIYLAD